MSKNKKRKNRNYRTNKTPAPKPKNNTWLWIVASIALIVAIAGAVWLGISLQNNAKEEYSPLEAEQYLEAKYNTDFLFIEEASGHYYLFEHESINNLIAVSPTSVILEEYDYPPNDLTEKYVDNAYYLLNEQKLVEFYQQYFPSNLGNHRIMPVFDAVCTPSNVTLETPARVVCDTYKAYGAPILWLLTDTQLSSETLATIEKSFEDSELPVALRIMMVDKDEQALMEPVDCILQFGQNRESVLLATNFHMDDAPEKIE